MKVIRLFLAIAAVAVLTSVAYVNQATESSGTKMVTAAEKFLSTLKDEQKARATFTYDDKERLNWHFIPLQDDNKKYTRKGLPLEEMTKEQRAAALEMVRAGTSADGYTQATTIMSLEGILRDTEKNGKMVRNPDWYFFSVFGTPSKTGQWGWRVEGHHLSMNFTLDKGAVVSATPAFFGANPATVLAGDRKGLRTVAAADDLARDLFAALDDDQKKIAHQSKLHDEPAARATKPTNVGDPTGLAAAKMTDKQKAILKKLIEYYAQRWHPDIAETELKGVQEAGIDKVHFTFAGSSENGKPRTYRVQGPTIVLEFLNTQPDGSGNPANHVHSAWRNLKGDFGLATK
jgi:hypothetical protein